ncbi:hypothetical protein [Lactiplantibacillus plantarum]|uniref:hypothetical protein n=1 Tax=Lactiplantibacillus plantarum TaxID=1590 RepID=UPI000932F3A6|nr:hypothetical protein [Lactiplantibacillus plantarum]MCG0834590.1 hypothetical protein [Lactiplantibacillus plantarum]MCT0220748.1 hypothetical protein [Lactiplantibacillus plantarum]MCW6117152.1 hypothetical protein [Lactiplantibacillus plantarum]QAA27243.1 hypothetical protein C0682_00745 [Lactiplantibacillus plantarum]WKF78313.1 hypothetical protein QY877_11635 [Lactiplantibacillus plantarum]
MINKVFYKYYRFWAGIVLLFLSANVYPDIFNGNIFGSTFWRNGSNLFNIIFAAIAIGFLIQVLFFKHGDPKENE